MANKTKFLGNTRESKYFLSTAKLLSIKRVLDVGCGYGRYLKELKKDFKVTGVEINETIRKYLSNEGIHAIHPKDLKKDEKYDMILMSHIIEHIQPEDLVEFLDHYLSRLEKGGHLMIATPLFNKYFYEDPTHTRPYDPPALLNLFNKKSQMMHHTKNYLEPVSIKFFRSPYLLKYRAHAHKINGERTRWAIFMLINIFSKLLFKLSFSAIGYRESWVGVFRKA